MTGDGTPTTGGTASVRDPDTSQSHFTAISSLTGTFGTFAFALGSGVFAYTLNNAAAQALTAADHPIEAPTLTSTDGSQTTIQVTVNGANEAPVSGFGATPAVFTGTGDTNDFDGLLFGAVVNINGSNTANTLRGSDNAELINAQKGIDTVFGHGGNDTIHGQGDADLLYGQIGTDMVAGSTGAAGSMVARAPTRCRATTTTTRCTADRAMNRSRVTTITTH